MGRRARITYEGALYHVFARGDKGEHIFSADLQKGYFAGTVIRGLKRCDAVLHAFCIMGNHYHLLLRTPKDNLSGLMHYIGSVFGSYFCRQRGVQGHVFDGRYRSLIVETNEYLLALTRYIHMNPVRAGLVPRPIQYRWSSYRFFSGHGRLPAWLDRSLILDEYEVMPGCRLSEYRDFVEQGLDRAGLEKEALIFDRALESGERSLEGAISKQRSLDRLARCVADYYDLDGLVRIGERSSGLINRARQAFIYLAKNHTDASNSAVALVAGDLSESAVSYHLSRVKRELEQDDERSLAWQAELAGITQFWDLSPELS